MKKKVKIEIHSDFIQISFNDVLKKHTVICEFVGLNVYQLVLNKITVINSKNTHANISSTELRKINIHTLIKRSIKLINAYIGLDKKSVQNKINFTYQPDLNYRKLLTEVHKNTEKTDRNTFLAKFSYVYIQTCLSYETNITTVLANKTGYSKSYIKNIIKEAFQKGYLKSSSKGISGGHLSNKTINCLKQ